MKLLPLLPLLLVMTTVLVSGCNDVSQSEKRLVIKDSLQVGFIWVWRDTPDAATNHDISYAKSRDLVHWQKSDGSDQPLPITIDNGEIIDAVPAGGGMLNGNTVIGFDHQDRPVVTYHKFDAEGRTQVYNARREENGWQIYQATGWDFRWDFGGRGSINNRVGVYPVQPEGDQLVQRFWIDTVGVQRYALDKSDLKAVEQLRADHTYPAYLDGVRADHPEMRVNMVTDKIDGEEYYLLRWESLNRNRDRPREAPVPAARPLELYHVVKE